MINLNDKENKTVQYAVHQCVSSNRIVTGNLSKYLCAALGCRYYMLTNEAPREYAVLLAKLRYNISNADGEYIVLSDISALLRKTTNLRSMLSNYRDRIYGDIGVWNDASNEKVMYSVMCAYSNGMFVSSISDTRRFVEICGLQKSNARNGGTTCETCSYINAVGASICSMCSKPPIAVAEEKKTTTYKIPTLNIRTRI